MKQMQQSGKKVKPLKVILVVLCTVLLVFLAAVSAVCISLAVRYHNDSFAYQPPVEREEPYVSSDYAYPDVIFDPETSAGEGEPVPETTASSAEITEAPPQTTALPVETTAPLAETTVPSAETTAPPAETTAPPAETRPSVPDVQFTPPETLAPVINVPQTQTPQTSYTPVYDPNASFANSPNAISVYGKVPVYKVEQKNQDIINILVLGTDSRDITVDRGRSDTMIIVSYNQKTGSVKLTSILRDALTPIAGHDWNRINTAYLFGGVGLAINTVNELFDLDIQQFVVIDLNGAEDLIDFVGGVDITLTQEEAEMYNAYYGTHYTAGVNHMEAVNLMQHMRNRDIGSDFERTRRQRDAIMAIIDKLLTEKSLAELYEIVNYSFGLVKTNIPLSSLTSLVTSVIGNISDLTVTAQHVPYADSYRFAMYRGMAIIFFDIADAAERVNAFIYDGGGA